MFSSNSSPCDLGPCSQVLAPHSLGPHLAGMPNGANATKRLRRCRGSDARRSMFSPEPTKGELQVTAWAGNDRRVHGGRAVSNASLHSGAGSQYAGQLERQGSAGRSNHRGDKRPCRKTLCDHPPILAARAKNGATGNRANDGATGNRFSTNLFSPPLPRTTCPNLRLGRPILVLWKWADEERRAESTQAALHGKSACGHELTDHPNAQRRTFAHASRTT